MRGSAWCAALSPKLSPRNFTPHTMHGKTKRPIPRCFITHQGIGLFYICLNLLQRKPRRGQPALTSHDTRRASVNTRHSGRGTGRGSDRAQRKPMLLLMLDGESSLRLAERALLSLLFHEPPRSTPSGIPTYRAQMRPAMPNYIVFSHPPNNLPISTNIPAT